jgi:hypothetical protein
VSAPAATTARRPAGLALVDELRAAGYAGRLEAPTIGAWRRRHGISPHDTRGAVLELLAAEMVNELRRIDCLDQLAQLRRLIAAGARPCAIATRLRALAAHLDAHTPNRQQEAAPCE